MRRASESSTRNSMPEGWLITSPRVGTRPARVKTRPPTVSISASRSSSVRIGPTLVLEILDRHAGVQVQRAVGAFGHHRRLDVVVLVGDVAGDGFDQVLDRYQAVDAAVFVHHQRQMDALRAASAAADPAPAVCGATISGLRRIASRREFLRPADIGKNVLDVDHADDVVELLAIDRQAGVAVVADQLDRLVQGHVGAHGDDVGARHHDVVGGGFAQPQDVGDQQPLVPVEFRRLPRKLLGVGGFLHQFGDGFAQRVFGLLAPQQIAEPAQEGGALARSCAFPGVGHADSVQDAGFGHFHAAGVAGMVVVLTAQVQRAVDDQMRQVMRRAAGLARRPPAGRRPAPG